MLMGTHRDGGLGCSCHCYCYDDICSRVMLMVTLLGRLITDSLCLSLWYVLCSRMSACFPSIYGVPAVCYTLCPWCMPSMPASVLSVFSGKCSAVLTSAHQYGAWQVLQPAPPPILWWCSDGVRLASESAGSFRLEVNIPESVCMRALQLILSTVNKCGNEFCDTQTPFRRKKDGCIFLMRLFLFTCYYY